MYYQIKIVWMKKNAPVSFLCYKQIPLIQFLYHVPVLVYEIERAPLIQSHICSAMWLSTSAAWWTDRFSAYFPVARHEMTPLGRRRPTWWRSALLCGPPRCPSSNSAETITILSTLCWSLYKETLEKGTDCKNPAVVSSF